MLSGTDVYLRERINTVFLVLQLNGSRLLLLKLSTLSIALLVKTITTKMSSSTTLKSGTGSCNLHACKHLFH